MSEPARPARPRGLILGLAAIAVLVTLASALSQSKVFFERDIHSYWISHRAALRTALTQGTLPLWNPWVGFGAPFLADASSELAYPSTWLGLPLPLPLQTVATAIYLRPGSASGASPYTNPGPPSSEVTEALCRVP